MRMTLPKPGRALRPLVPRVFAVLAAALLLSALALATLAPMDMTLGDAIGALDAEMLAAVRTRMTALLGAWAWRDVVAPFMVRPLWLVPVSLGVICLGAALSFSLSPPRQQHRRRS